MDRGDRDRLLSERGADGAPSASSSFPFHASPSASRLYDDFEDSVGNILRRTRTTSRSELQERERRERERQRRIRQNRETRSERKSCMYTTVNSQCCSR